MRGQSAQPVALCQLLPGLYLATGYKADGEIVITTVLHRTLHCGRSGWLEAGARAAHGEGESDEGDQAEEAGEEVPDHASAAAIPVPEPI
jgi:hypothetical protein